MFTAQAEKKKRRRRDDCSDSDSEEEWIPGVYEETKPTKRTYKKKGMIIIYAIKHYFSLLTVAVLKPEERKPLVKIISQAVRYLHVQCIHVYMRPLMFID